MSVPVWLLVLALFAGRAASALPGYITFPSDVDWVTRESPHFQALYRRGNDDFAIRSLKAAERAYTLLTAIFPEAPEKTWIILADFQDSTNGYSLDFPYPHIVIFASPPDPREELSSLDDWLASVILHEYVHTLHLYPAHGIYHIMKILFGTGVVPNGLMPRTLHEGMADFFETHLTEGGRGRSSTWDMWRRMAVKAGVWGNDFVPLDLMDGTDSIWPGGSSAYFFGYYLYQEAWQRKGAQGIRDLTLEFSSNWPYFISRPFEHVYGTSYPDLWTDIYKKNEQEAKQEIRDIESTPLSTPLYLTHTKFQKWDLTLSPDGKQLAYRKYTPKDGGVLEIMDLATKKVVKDVPLFAGPTSGLCWGKRDGHDWLIYLRQSALGPYVEQAFTHYAINTLWAYDLTTDANIPLVRPVHPLYHLHRLSCSPDLSKILVYREADTKGYAVQLSWDGKSTDGEGKVLEVRKWRLPVGTWITSSLLSNDGAAWIGLRQRKGSTTTLLKWDPSELAPHAMLDIPANVYGLEVGSRSGQLLAVADKDRRDEIWAVDVPSHRMEKRIGLLGGTSSFVEIGKEFFFTSYEHGGYDIAEASPLVPNPIPIPTPKVDKTQLEPDVAISAEKEYSPFATLYPRAWVPEVLFVPNGAQFGAWVPGFDASQKNVYDLFGGYDTRGLPFADLTYGYRFGTHYDVSAEAYMLPSYLIQYNAFLNQWGATVGLGGLLPAYLPYLKADLLFKRTEASVFGPADQSIGVGLELSQGYGIHQRPLDISPTSGTRFSLTHQQYFKALGSNYDYFATTAQVDQYVGMPWEGHVLYLSARAGYTQGDELIDSIFQGGGELLFYQQRGFFLVRGFNPGEFLGRRMVTFNPEYRFPIARIERGVGTWPLFLQAIHGAVVADVITYDYGTPPAGSTATNPDNLFKEFYYSAGLELSTDWIVSYYLPTRVRLGAYHGFGPYGDDIYVTLGIEASL